MIDMELEKRIDEANARLQASGCAYDLLILVELCQQRSPERVAEMNCLLMQKARAA